MASMQPIHLPGDLNSESKSKPKIPYNHVRMNSANFSDATPSSSLESTDLNWGQYAPGSTQNPNLRPQELKQDSYTLYQHVDSYGYQVSSIQKPPSQEMDFRRNPEAQGQVMDFRPNSEFRRNPEDFYRHNFPNQNYENGVQNQQNNVQKRQNSFPNRENSYQSQESGYWNQEGNFQNHINDFQKREHVFQTQETQMPHNEKGIQNREIENYSQNHENGYQNGNFGMTMEANNNAQRNLNLPETVNTQFPMDTMSSYADKGGYTGENSIHQAQLLELASKLDSSLPAQPTPVCSGNHVYEFGCPDDSQELLKCKYKPIVENLYELPIFNPPPMGTFEESVNCWQNNRVLKLRNV